MEKIEDELIIPIIIIKKNNQTISETLKVII